MEAITKGNTKMGRNTERDVSHGQIALLTRVIGNSTKCTGMGYFAFLMVELTLESISMIESMAEESSLIPMGERRKATGKTGSKLDLRLG